MNEGTCLRMMRLYSRSNRSWCGRWKANASTAIWIIRWRKVQSNDFSTQQTNLANLPICQFAIWNALPISRAVQTAIPHWPFVQSVVGLNNSTFTQTPRHTAPKRIPIGMSKPISFRQRTWPDAAHTWHIPLDTEIWNILILFWIIIKP